MGYDDGLIRFLRPWDPCFVGRARSLGGYATSKRRHLLRSAGNAYAGSRRACPQTRTVVWREYRGVKGQTIASRSGRCASISIKATS